MAWGKTYYVDTILQFEKRIRIRKNERKLIENGDVWAN